MRAVALDLDALGDTRPLWQAWLEDAARRFRSIADLDPAGLPADRAEAAAELDRWAEQGVGDWRAALGRFSDDHAPVHLRPSAEVARALRGLEAAKVRVGVFTDAPEPLARAALRQLGASRRTDLLETGANALERLLERLGEETVVVRTRGELGRLPR